VVKLDMRDINKVYKLLAKDVVSFGVNRSPRCQRILLVFLVVNLLDLMVEQVIPTAVFKLVDLVGALDLRGTRKGMLLVTWRWSTSR
jgi:hypothetical protein